MNTEAMQAILEKIKAYDRIVLFRHKRPDGDAVGSTLGLRQILRLTYPEKEICVINNDYADYVAFLGEEDGPREDEFYASALGIVLDTATTDRISNPKYALCRELIKIDHHLNVAPYGDLSWVEEESCATSEMVAAFYHTFREEMVIDRQAAEIIFAGIVTDSGRFRFRSVSGDTMRYAGMLLDLGVDTDRLYAELYMKSFETYPFQSYLYRRIRRTENGVAYLYVSQRMQKRFGMSSEDASATVSYMDSIRDSLIWIAFIENSDGTLRVRLRSRFATVNEIASHYRGGGHANAAGATLYKKREIKALLKEADEALRRYKATHEGWL